MFARVIVLVAIVNRALMTHVLVPFAVMAVIVGGCAAFLYFAADRPKASLPKGISKSRIRSA